MKAKEKINDLNNRVYNLEDIVRKLCPHNIVIQEKYKSKYYNCELCGKFFSRDVMPKRTTICEYRCNVKK